MKRVRTLKHAPERSVSQDHRLVEVAAQLLAEVWMA